VINRHHKKKSVISSEEAEESVNQKIFWFVPNDYPTTMSAINQGRTLSSVAPGAEVSRNLQELASRLLERGEKGKGKTRFWSEVFK
jgi:pilus assembly protein CpaE